ncbi:acid-sensing ion channel 2-like isoform X2 [Hydractinia symbiolongicarpus]|nr:acid-sensing ion channel 2-like isoform X2 [Hydractinia symbiolongicarpus]XP_057313736.1 acid-sensing ion channel 2-like isoform X2 [Hydractinia symbiolongicarpus]
MAPTRFSDAVQKAVANTHMSQKEPDDEDSIPLTTFNQTPNTEEFTEEKNEKKENTGMAGIAWRLHAANKAAGVFKEKANLRRRIRERLKLKERMRQLVEERLTVRQIFKRYVESSTLHGFRYTCTDTYLLRRAIWTLLMVAGAIYFILKLHDGLVTYFDYPFSTKATLEYVNKLTFPAISFCPLNQFSFSKVKNSSLKKLFKKYGSPFQRNLSNWNHDFSGRELASEIRRTSFSIEDINQDCDYIRRDTDHPNLPHQPCGTENFTSYFSESGKLCFTLNSGKIGHRLLEVDHAGLNYGFELMFDLRNEDAIKEYQISGLQVIVHDQNEPPVSNTGFILPPGFKSYIKMEQSETQNLPPPFATKCGETKLKYFSTYNQKSCILELLTDYVGERCKCRELFMPDNGMPYCSLRQRTSCLYQVKDSFNEYKMRSQCPVDCRQISYVTRRSDSKFLHNPPTGIEPILIKKSLEKKELNRSHILELYKKYSNEEFAKYIEENIIVVIFYYGEMSKVIYMQTASFNFYNFLGDIGGAFGLMLGASLLTFFEFVDLLTFLIYHQLLRLHKQQKLEKENRKSMVLEEKQSLIT